MPTTTTPTVSDPAAATPRLVDAHLHFADFLRGTDGMPSLLQRMDEAGVAKAVIFGMPLVKKRNAYDPVEPHYTLDDSARCYFYSYTDQLLASACESLAPGERARFAPLACGFNPTDRHRDLTLVWEHCGLSRRVAHERYHEMIDRMLAAYPRLAVDASWVGFDDVTCAGGALTRRWYH